MKTNTNRLIGARLILFTGASLLAAFSVAGVARAANLENFPSDTTFVPSVNQAEKVFRAWEKGEMLSEAWVPSLEPLMAATLIESANELVQAKRAPEAIHLYREALVLRPDYAAIWFALGKTQYRENQTTDAIRSFQNTLRLKQKSHATWNNLGLAYADIGQYTLAVQAYRAALDIRPREVTTWTNLGIAYSAMKRHDQAMEAYNNALKVQPEHAHSWYLLGVLYVEQGRQEDATQAYEALRKLDAKLAKQLHDYLDPTETELEKIQ